MDAISHPPTDKLEKQNKRKTKNFLQVNFIVVYSNSTWRKKDEPASLLSGLIFDKYVNAAYILSKIQRFKFIEIFTSFIADIDNED